jgi:hypothetical protein
MFPYNTEDPSVHLPVTIGPADGGREMNHSDRPTTLDVEAYVWAGNMLLSKQFAELSDVSGTISPAEISNIVQVHWVGPYQ